ncbi:phosphatidylinositol-binding protein scs2 [Podochytrium sp. JEL0797]|nr:phosphatidylinositol-binding protein scs2 [Podochytrium sp. JEL0797]
MLVVAEEFLEFRRPFTSVVKQQIHVSNSSASEMVAFKVKTTAPKQYCVRPNAGVVGAGQSKEIEVLLQAMAVDPPLDTKCKDKFLVQSIFVSSEVALLSGDAQATRLAELWLLAEDKKKAGDTAAVAEVKLRCLFANESSQAPAVPLPVPKLSSKESDRDLADAKDAIKRLTNACEAYKTEIERLNSLRQRKAVGGDKAEVAGSATSQIHQQNGNVLPLPLVLALAIIAFILGALIF